MMKQTPYKTSTLITILLSFIINTIVHASDSTSCQPGTYIFTSQGSNCQSCPPGTYSDTTGSYWCTPCLDTMYQLEGANSVQKLNGESYCVLLGGQGDNDNLDDDNDDDFFGIDINTMDPSSTTVAPTSNKKTNRGTNNGECKEGDKRTGIEFITMFIFLSFCRLLGGQGDNDNMDDDNDDDFFDIDYNTMDPSSTTVAPTSNNKTNKGTNNGDCKEGDNRSRIENITMFLSNEGIGCNPSPDTMNRYGKELFDTGYESVEMIKKHLKKNHIQSFGWMKDLHKRILVKNLFQA